MYVLVAAVISAPVLVGPGIGTAAVGSSAGSRTASGSGSVLWTSIHPGAGYDVAADPRGGKVFVVGPTALVAYDASTGAKLWDNGAAHGQSVAVSNDGKVIFVIRHVRTNSGSFDFLTAAFDSVTGRQLWATRYNGRANGVDIPVALAVSPGGSAVFVTGKSKGRTSGLDYATVAYAAATGNQLWVSRYNGHGRSADIPAAIAVSPGGGAVYVTGTGGTRRGEDFATVAYSAATGATLWTRRYGQPEARNAAFSVAASPDGHRIFVTGESKTRGSGIEFATVAYAASTGARLWVRRYHGPADRNDYADQVLVSPRGGGTVVVIGSRNGSTVGYVFVAYSAVTGRTKWVSRFVPDSFQQEFLGGAVLSPDGLRFYMTGYAMVVPGGEEPSRAVAAAAKVATGTLSWSKVVNTNSTNQLGVSVAVNPDGATVYVLVEDYTPTAPQDFATVAFRD